VLQSVGTVVMGASNSMSKPLKSSKSVKAQLMCGAACVL
jgi:hypothetical protein